MRCVEKKKVTKPVIGLRINRITECTGWETFPIKYRPKMKTIERFHDLKMAETIQFDQTDLIFNSQKRAFPQIFLNAARTRVFRQLHEEF